MRGININGDAAFKFSEFATKVAGLMNTERDDGDAGIFKTVPSRCRDGDDEIFQISELRIVLGTVTILTLYCWGMAKVLQ